MSTTELPTEITGDFVVVARVTDWQNETSEALEYVGGLVDDFTISMDWEVAESNRKDARETVQTPGHRSQEVEATVLQTPQADVLTTTGVRDDTTGEVSGKEQWEAARIMHFDAEPPANPTPDDALLVKDVEKPIWTLTEDAAPTSEHMTYSFTVYLNGTMYVNPTWADPHGGA